MNIYMKFPMALVLAIGIPCMSQDPGKEDLDWATPEFPVSFVNPEGHVTTLTIKGPFATPGSAVYASGTDKPDLSESDGWMLVCKDLGGGRTTPSLPYFIIYNKFRGIIRAFIYNSRDISYNSYSCKLRFDGGQKLTPATQNQRLEDSKSSPSFTFSSGISCFSNNYDGSAVQSSINNLNMDRFGGWITADFAATGFDPQLKGKDLALTLTVEGIDITQVKLTSNGSISLSQVMDTLVPTAEEVDGNRGSAFDSTSSGYINFRKNTDAVSEIIKTNRSTWVMDAVAFATAASGYPELAPLTSSLAGTITSCIGGGKSQSIPLNFKGKIQFDTNGTLTSSHRVLTTAFFLNPGEPRVEAPRPSHPIPWGIFNLDQQPDLIDNVQDIGLGLYNHQITFANAPGILVNPDIGFTYVRKGIAFTFDDAPPGMAVAPSMATPGGTYFDYSNAPGAIYSFTSRTANLPTGMALQLLCGIPGTPVLMPRQNEILKVYPVTAKPRMSVKITIGRFEHDSRGVTYHLGASVANVDPGTPLTYTWTLARGLGTFQGQNPKVHAGMDLEGIQGTLTVTDGHGFRVDTPFATAGYRQRGGR